MQNLSTSTLDAGFQHAYLTTVVLSKTPEYVFFARAPCYDILNSFVSCVQGAEDARRTGLG
jgi:hypothetical protein